MSKPTKRSKKYIDSTVQAALVRHRLGVALAAGCDLIASSAVTGGASERNLGRLGFQPVLQVTTWRRGE